MKRFIWLFFLLCSIATACMDGEWCVYSYNNSDIDLGFYEPSRNLDRLWHHEKRQEILGGGCFPWQYFEYNDYLDIFLYDYNEVVDLPWNEVRDRKYIVKYSFTRDDLEKLNYRIFFPPTEAMKDVLMDPPYEEVIEKYPPKGDEL